MYCVNLKISRKYSHNLAEKYKIQDKTKQKNKIFKKSHFRPKTVVSDIPLPEDEPDRSDEPMPEEDKSRPVDAVGADGGHSEPIHTNTTQVRDT